MEMDQSNARRKRRNGPEKVRLNVMVAPEARMRLEEMAADDEESLSRAVEQAIMKAYALRRAGGKAA